MRGLLVAAAAMAVLAGAAVASDSGAGQKPGRFAMQPVEGGFVRLDTATGEVTQCLRSGGQLECKPVEDGRDLQREIGRLSEENKELRAEVRRLEERLGVAGGDAPGARKFELPSEADVDKALSYLERMFKKFRDKMKDFESEMEKPAEKKGQPL